MSGGAKETRARSFGFVEDDAAAAVSPNWLWRGYAGYDAGCFSGVCSFLPRSSSLQYDPPPPSNSPHGLVDVGVYTGERAISTFFEEYLAREERLNRVDLVQVGATWRRSTSSP